MKNIRLTLLGLMLLFSATFPACKKDKDKTRTDLLTQKVWLTDVRGFDENSNGVVDADENDVEACENDDTDEYKTDHTMISSDNANLCGSGDVEYYNWSLVDNDQKLVFTEENQPGSDTFFIKVLDDNTLELYQDIDLGSGQIVRDISRFKH